MKIVEKLSTYAALIGVIGAIGGGFYTWGQFNTRLDVIEKKKFVVNQTVDLDPLQYAIDNNDFLTGFETENEATDFSNMISTMIDMNRNENKKIE